MRLGPGLRSLPGKSLGLGERGTGVLDRRAFNMGT